MLPTAALHVAITSQTQGKFLAPGRRLQSCYGTGSSAVMQMDVPPCRPHALSHVALAGRSSISVPVQTSPFLEALLALLIGMALTPLQLGASKSSIFASFKFPFSASASGWEKEPILLARLSFSFRTESCHPSGLAALLLATPCPQKKTSCPRAPGRETAASGLTPLHPHLGQALWLQQACAALCCQRRP